MESKRWAGRLRPFVAEWLIAPSLYRTLKRLVAGREGSLTRLWPESYSQGNVQESGLTRLRFSDGSDFHWVSLNRCVSAMGASFTVEQHHLVRYLAEGSDSLRRYFDLQTPQDSFEVVFDEAPPDYKGKHNGIWRKPWRETGLGMQNADRNNWWGPVTDRKFEAEKRKLLALKKSIAVNGYTTVSNKLEEFPFYQILLNDSNPQSPDYRLQIQAGQHRVATLAHLGWEYIPVRPSNGLREVRLSDLESWPGVVDGTFSTTAAERFFHLHFRPSRTQLIP